VKLLFAEFCKRVGLIYAQVQATAELRNDYFSEDDAGDWGDDGSCFLPRGCNKQHGKLLDASPCTGVITMLPKEKYAKGRIIVWFKNSTTAHLINKYSDSDGRELPHSVFARALEMLTGTTVSWKRDSTRTLPIYLNNNPMICNVTGETNFDAVIKSYKLKCTECGCLYNAGDSPEYMCCDCIDSADEDRVTCEHCGERTNNDDSVCVNDNYYCSDCYNDLYFYCEHCSTDCDRDDAVETYDARGHQNYTVCSECASNYPECEHCGHRVHEDNSFSTDDGTNYCNRCVETQTATCAACGMVSDDLDQFDDDGNCEDCHVDEVEEDEAVAS
jgi:hypothetical protein